MLMSLIRITAVLFFLAAGSHAQDTVSVGNVPLPVDVDATAPAAGIFAGTWVGQFDNQRNHILIVERFRNDASVDVVYAVGSDLNGPGRWFRRKAKIEGNVLVFAGDGFPARYQLSASGRMRGVFDDNKGFAILERQELSELLSTPADDWFSIGNTSYLQTNLVEDGKSAKLSVVTYDPPGDGPFPLALIHHGSTGRGTHPRDFDYVWSNDWLADVLNENGWLVAFPQRRGRGLSDGLYDEGFALDRTQGYSPTAALSLPGAERALLDANAALEALKKRPDVDSGKVLVGGMSRGGVLAIMQAGSKSDEVAGVINFVGGWISEKHGDPSINPTLFRRIEAFGGPVLSIYGEEDPFYSVEHSKSNVAEMEALGAKSRLHVVKLPGYGNGHWVIGLPNLWENLVTEFLEDIDLSR